MYPSPFPRSSPRHFFPLQVALVIYNDDIRNMVGGCYATNLSLATPANVHLFQNLLKTAPDARGNKRSVSMSRFDIKVKPF